MRRAGPLRTVMDEYIFSCFLTYFNIQIWRRCFLLVCIRWPEICVSQLVWYRCSRHSTCCARLAVSRAPHFVGRHREDGHRVTTLHLSHHRVLAHAAQQLHAVYRWNKHVRIFSGNRPAWLVRRFTSSWTHISPGWGWRPWSRSSPPVWRSAEGRD